MNNHQKCYRRDNELLAALNEWGVLNTEHIQQLFFSNVSLRMAQKRLQRLVELKKVLRARDYTGQPFYYYLERRPGQSEHKLGVNWIRLWLDKCLKSWESTYCWQYEPDYKIVRPDAFTGIKNTITGKISFYFIERECDTNQFKKVKVYNDLYSTGGYAGSWWANKTDRFPVILIAVESETRKMAVEKLIEKNNKHGLEFKVYLMDHIIQKVKGVR